ncbi:MAG: anthranilate phosphoribosyltransferase [Alphaproteobacteria bacterium]|jgi:anthranilate phosphoribosyltransferase|nr:anthranilate phosphoribosyltransferase [Alphaproteobacteria bacterium]MDP6238331.1 anthranilate phosphoribosyltransferase [Alphaproteobacteria bacterium]MDP7173137.1 anthranilate phosphoribosyltransferase [Alphaproteobacteria bacterium]MDP7233528.1 anthranilate phosphoribosyltransferase [Alphaproteobacteria bacterium]|tara:strand:+ start:1166 stop:2185 length:1020 start_codon:yes stop_codon:yes gene_type:complete
MADIKPLIAKLATGSTLTEDEAHEAFDIMMSGDATPSQTGAFLMGLRVRGETVDEITGAAKAMRLRALVVNAPPDTVDTCGTGGDASGSYNVSTGAALVVAACGVPVAKHGNRALSSKSGSADILTALGVNIEADIPLVERAITEVGIGFLMAPRHHGAMRHVAGTRVELGTRTIFNILGPLSNPAGTERQVIGVFDAKWLRPVAEVLGKLGSSRVWVVHGDDGMDELTTTASSQVAELRDGNVSTFSVTPEDAGLTRAAAAALKGGDPKENAAALRAVLDGEVSAYRDIVLLNAAAALVVAERAANLAEGVAQATAAVDGGKAREVLAKLVDITNGSA